MNKSMKSFVIRTAAIAALSAAVMSNASARVVFFRPAVVVAPVLVAAPVVVVAPIYVPVCRFVAVPFVNAYTGVTYLATRRVCN